MNQFPNPSLDRRRLLRSGGMAVTMGAILAACGSDRGGNDDPGRIGVADEAPKLPAGEVDDVVLLRTAQSLEYTALGVYEAAGSTGALNAAETSLAGRFVADHTGHAAMIGALITDLGGDEFQCPNPFVGERIVTPVLAALAGSDDLHRDLLNIAYAFEAWAAASYQALVGALGDPMLRRHAMHVGTEENRHAAALARVINPDQLVSPALFNKPVGNDDDGFPVPYAVNAVFGKLSGIDLVVGSRDSDGSRFSTQLQTPAANSFVYGYQAC